MPSTYENDHIQAADYADFGDLSENVFFPEEFDISQFGNQSLPSVIWSNSGAQGEQIWILELQRKIHEDFTITKKAQLGPSPGLKRLLALSHLRH